MADKPTQLIAARQLPLGHKLLWYEIEDTLGQGGFGITYLATDTNLNRKVAIKEYLPTSFAHRNHDSTVRPISGNHEDLYNWGLSSFLNEARTLAQFRHPNLVQVHTVFEDHNTAYMVMEYERGDSLARLIARHRDGLNQEFFENLLYPVLDGLQEIHNAGFIHRDIKPANIYLRFDSSPVLIDFGSARLTSQQESGEMTTLVSQGYTPLEQYSSNFGDQGPWTDIYSIGASVYHGITGKRPIDSMHRSTGLLAGKDDTLQPLSNMDLTEYSPVFLSAIDSAMRLRPEDRPQTLSEWRGLFSDDQTTYTPFSDLTVRRPSARRGIDSAEATRVLTKGSQNQTEYRRRKETASEYSRSGNAPAIMALASTVVLVTGLGAAFWWYKNQDTDANSLPAPEIATLSAEHLAQLPRPATALTLIDPGDRLKAELSDLKSLSLVYRQALDLDQTSKPAKDGIAYVVSQYARLAKSPFVVADKNSRDLLSNELSALGGYSKGVADLIQQLQNIPQVSFAGLSPLLAKKTLSASEQQELLAGLAALSKPERDIANKDTRVITLFAKLRKSIVENLEAGNFELAARMIEVALLVSPDDGTLDNLRLHLEG